MIQQAQLIMTVEEITHRPDDSVVYMRLKNPVNRRDSSLILSAGFGQVQDVKLGQRFRVTVETVDVASFKCGSCGGVQECEVGKPERCSVCGGSLYLFVGGKEPSNAL
jgi:hypothetical protein